MGDETEYINLKVVDHFKVLSQIHFRAKKFTQMGKQKKSYSEQRGLDVTSYRFLFDGRQIKDYETPNNWGMEEDDVIEVYRALPDSSHECHNL